VLEKKHWVDYKVI